MTLEPAHPLPDDDSPDDDPTAPPAAEPSTRAVDAVKAEEAVDAVVFDVGGVLVDWDPRYLYRTIFDDERELEWFLEEVCTPEWNLAQDLGRPWADAVAEATERFPSYAEAIRAYDERWTETLGEPFEDTVALVGELRSRGVRTYGLTNFSAEKWPIAVRLHPFLGSFDGVVVSGQEGVVKPDHAIYRILLDRYALEPASTFFVDDRPTNVLAAREVGLRAEVFLGAEGLRADLRSAGAPV